MSVVSGFYWCVVVVCVNSVVVSIHAGCLLFWLVECSWVFYWLFAVDWLVVGCLYLIVVLLLWWLDWLLLDCLEWVVVKVLFWFVRFIVR